MTELVTCRVCGLASPLGTLECPDCGAPLPQKPSREPSREPTGELLEPTETPVPEGRAEKGERIALSKIRGFFARRPTVRRAALLLAAALVIQLTAILWPKKWRPTGITYWEDGLITEHGLWDTEEEGLFWFDATADGRYVLLRKWSDENAASRVRGAMDIMLSATQTSLTSFAYAPTGDYYLFDGRTLEHTDWTFAVFGGNDAVFYTRTDDTGTTLSRRELTTGRVDEIQRFEGTGELGNLSAALDGSAAAYYWLTDGALDPGAQVQKDYRLWRRGDRQTVSLGDADSVTVGIGGEICVLNFYDRDTNVWSWGDYQYTAWGDSIVPLGGGQSYSSIWQNGEVAALPSGMSVHGCSADLTQLILRDSQASFDRGWYFYNAAAGGRPQRLDLSGERYLSWNGVPPDRLTGRFYFSYGDATSAHYLTHKGELLTVEERLDEEGLATSFLAAPDGQSAVYLKNGELYRVTVHPDDTLETGQLTQTDNLSNGDPVSGSVSIFAASEDLSHIYYVAQDVSLPQGMRLFHWHNGKARPLDMELADYLKPSMTVTPDGGCYLVYRQDLYYTDGTAAAAVVGAQEDLGAFVDAPWLVGPDKWPMARSVEWESNRRQYRYWRLKGYDEPVELKEWYPKEGKV